MCAMTHLYVCQEAFVRVPWLIDTCYDWFIRVPWLICIFFACEKACPGRKGSLGCVYVALCCRVLQCVAVCYNMLQCVAVCCNVLQCTAVYCSVLQWAAPPQKERGSKVHTCAVTQSLMCHDALICVPLLVRTCVRERRTCVWERRHARERRRLWGSCLYNVSLIRVPWLIRMCAMPHSYVCHDSFICVSWLIHTRAITHSYYARWHSHIYICVCHDSFIRVPWLIHTCATIHS